MTWAGGMDVRLSDPNCAVSDEELIVLLDESLRIVAERHPSREAFVDGSGRTTFGGLWKYVLEVASAIRAAGVGPGERVTVLSESNTQLVALYYACALSGAVLVPLNFRLNSRELSEIVEDADPVLHVATSNFADLLGPSPRPTVCVYDEGVQRSLLDALGREGSAGLSGGFPARSPEDVVTMMYTSGTTGAPKGVRLTHRNIMAKALASIGCVWGWDRGGVHLSVTPLFHVGVTHIFEYVILGGKNVLLPRFDPGEALATMESEGTTSTGLSPTTIAMLMEETDDALPGSLKKIMYGGSTIPASVLNQFLDRNDHVDLAQGYGLTESCSILTVLQPEDHRLSGEEGACRRRSAGYPVVTMEVRVVDDAGAEVARGTPGEIVAAGPQVMKGYWRRAHETEATIRDGFLYTGDVGTMNETGYLTIIDRKSELITTGGENVSSAEVEEAIRSHEAVLDVAVVGLPDDRWVEAVSAAIVVRPGAGHVSEEAITAKVRARLAGYKCPRVVAFVEEIPKTATGKAKKGDVRQLLLRKLGNR